MHINELVSILEGIIRNFKCSGCQEAPDLKNLQVDSIFNRTIKMNVNCEKCGLNHSITAGLQPKEENEKESPFKALPIDNSQLEAMAVGVLLRDAVLGMKQKLNKQEDIGLNLQEIETHIQNGVKARDIFGSNDSEAGDSAQ